MILACAALLVAALQDDEVQQSVVKIHSSISPPDMFRPWEISTPSKSGGSGVVLAGKRILTNAHVVAYAQQIYVQPNKSSEQIAASVEFMSAECDLAVLKLDESEDSAALKAVELADERGSRS